MGLIYHVLTLLTVFTIILESQSSPYYGTVAPPWRREIQVITFYQHPVCNGRSFGMTLGNGECRKVPDDIAYKGWNLSVDPQGNCIKVYDNPTCREAISVGYSARVSQFREDVIERCRSTKELGFDIVRSFKRVPC